MSCVNSVSVNLPNDYTLSNIKLKQGGRIEINGLEAAVYQPIIVGLNQDIWIGRVGPGAVMLIFKDGLQLTFDGFTYVFMDAPPSYANQTMGLCGNFDSIAENDLMNPDGSMEASPETFGHEWRVKELCDPKNENANATHPCEMNKENAEQAMDACAKLDSELFEKCDVDPEPYTKDCLFDMCACQGDLADCMCTIFSAFANECNRQGQPVQWKQKVPECGRLL